MLRQPILRIGMIALVFAWAGMAQAQYLLTGARSGGALQIGTGLPLPVGPGGIFLGGQTPGDAGNFPPLGVGVNPAFQYGVGASTIMATGATGTTGMGAALPGPGLIFPPSVLTKVADGVPNEIAVFPTNPAVFQVGTSIDFAWPAAPATLQDGAGPGPNFFPFAGGTATYSGGTRAFGGAAQFSIAAGSGAGTHLIPPNGSGVAPIATVFINAGGATAPPAASIALVVGASNAAGLGANGGSLNTAGTAPATSQTSMFGVGNIFGISAGPAGTIFGAVLVGPGPAGNNVILSGGFPWTTGFITLAHATGGETFFLSGGDNRVAGSGNLSLVSGALSQRTLSGGNGNRGWLNLQLATPEPAAVLGASSALGVLGLCHLVVRRRRQGSKA